MKNRIIISIIAIVIILTSLTSCADKEMMNRAKEAATGTETVEQEKNTSHESSTELDTTEPSTEAMTETEVTSDEVSEPLTPLEAAIKTVTDEVESKEWVDIEVFEGEVDPVEHWGGPVVEPHVIEEGSVVYTVIGKSENQLYNNPFHVVVIIVFNEESNEWRKEEIYYICKGRRMWSTYIRDYFPTEYETKEIVSADNKVLFDYMYGY